MAHNHQHIRIALLNQARDLEVPRTLRPEVLMHQEIIHVPDQDQILQSQAIVLLSMFHRRQIFNLLDLLHLGQFPNRDLIQDLFLDPVLAPQKHQSIRAPDQDLPSLFDQDPDQDQDQLIQKKSKLVQGQDQDLYLDPKKSLVRYQHHQVDLQ